MKQQPLPGMPQPVGNPFVWAWVKRHSPWSAQALIKRDGEFNDAERFAWEAAGWDLVEDKGTSVDEVRRNLADGVYIDRNLQDVYAFERACGHCGSYQHTDLVTATQWTQSFGVVTGSRPFRGYLCEPCQHDDDRFSNVKQVEPPRRAGVA